MLLKTNKTLTNFDVETLKRLGRAKAMDFIHHTIEKEIELDEKERVRLAVESMLDDVFKKKSMPKSVLPPNVENV